ncbi:MAG: HAMP domain-containing histidine kinase [Deltaproteobacteria bacterium]|nr:HAMP domain-containing histidine kinase [Deltaproteobacteria bacterium]
MKANNNHSQNHTGEPSVDLGNSHKSAYYSAYHLRQVAHDLRSPLSVLDNLLRYCWNDLNPEIANLLLSAIQRLQNISDDVLNNTPKEMASSKKYPRMFSNDEVRGLIKNMIAEKQMQCMGKQNIKFNFSPHDSENESRAAQKIRLEPVEFQRILSNILNNSIEALEQGGEIQIELSNINKNTTLCISDNGQGIPSDVLPKLMKEGATFGKEKGNGLGLFHAINTIQGWGGDLTIESQWGVGTRVNIIFLNATTAAIKQDGTHTRL